MNNSSHIAAAAAVLVAVSSASLAVAAPVTYLNDTFSDNERATQSLPGSAKWIVGAHHSTASNAYGTLDATSGKMVLDHTRSSGVNSYAATWAHFAPGGSPVTVNVGETMKLSFKVSFSGGGFHNGTGGFRFALLNSNNSRPTADFAGNNATGIQSGSLFNSWRGYEGQSPIYTSLIGTGGSKDFITRERTGSGSGLFTSSEWAALANGNAVEPIFNSTTTYDGSLALTRTLTGMSVQATLAGVTTDLVTDTTSPFVSFDTVAFFVLDGLSHNLTFDDVKVVVPEPSSIAAIGVAGLALLARRRRDAARG